MSLNYPLILKITILIPRFHFDTSRKWFYRYYDSKTTVYREYLLDCKNDHNSVVSYLEESHEDYIMFVTHK